MVKSSGLPDIDMLHFFAHELRGPLGSIRSYVELMGQFGPLNEQQQRYSERVMVNVARIQMMIGRLLDYAAAESVAEMRFEACDLGAMVNDAVLLLAGIAEQKQITMHVDLDPSMRILHVDPLWFGHVISNLVSNGLKYNRENGEIWVRSYREGEQACIEVQDTGVGIAPEQISRIFEPFSRAGRSASDPIEGSGLGLSIVKLIVERHHGSVIVSSQPGQGTRFRVLLPLMTSPHALDDVEREALDNVEDDLQESSEDVDTESNDTPSGI